MSDKEFVLSIYPEAVCSLWKRVRVYSVLIPSEILWSGQMGILGEASTARVAWKMAAMSVNHIIMKRLES